MSEGGASAAEERGSLLLPLPKQHSAHLLLRYSKQQQLFLPAHWFELLHAYEQQQQGQSQFKMPTSLAGRGQQVCRSNSSSSRCFGVSQPARLPDAAAPATAAMICPDTSSSMRGSSGTSSYVSL